MSTLYTINWYSNDESIINSPELQRYFQEPLSSLSASDIKTKVRALPLTKETAPIISYYCALLRILALTA